MNEKKESLFAGLNPLGKGLVSLAGLFAVCLIVFYVVVVFSSTTIEQRATTSTPLRQGQPEEVGEYRWDSRETLLVTASKEGPHHPRCTVKPDAGEERSFFAWDVTSKLRSKGTQLEPWFDGAATMRCTTLSKDRQTADIYAGRWAELKSFSDSLWFYVIGALLIGTPFLLGLSMGKKRSPEGQGGPGQ